MKRVYLDWGVISNLKRPEFAEVREFLLSHKGDLFFVYSPAHFEDAMRSKRDDRLLQDIQTLESLVDNHLIAYNKKTAQPFLATPGEEENLWNNNWLDSSIQAGFSTGLIVSRDVIDNMKVTIAKSEVSPFYQSSGEEG